MVRRMFENKLLGGSVVVASHIYATGPALELEEYLINKTKGLLFIGHPFAYRKNRNSFFRRYRRGKLIAENESWGNNLLPVMFYFRDAFLTFWWVLRAEEKVDIFIGSDNFLAFVGLLLKRVGKVKRVVLYTIDYVPRRFSNPILNYLYHFFDRRCMRECVAVWNVSKKIGEARKEERGIGGRGWAKQIVVPLGVWYERIRFLSFEKKRPYRLVFMGHLLEKQGLWFFQNLFFQQLQ